jgi:hypothetical protein
VGASEVHGLVQSGFVVLHHVGSNRDLAQVVGVPKTSRPPSRASPRPPRTRGQQALTGIEIKIAHNGLNVGPAGHVPDGASGPEDAR